MRRPPRLDEAAYLRAALHHLARYPSTTAGLQRVLRRRRERAARQAPEESLPSREETDRIVGVVLAQMARAGLLDDVRLAHALAADLLRRGCSPAMIRARLRGKGVPAELASTALAAGLAAAAGDPVLSAATAYARRRRLGPFRADPATRGERRGKDLAALGRRGFSWEVARTVIDAELPEDLPSPEG